MQEVFRCVAGSRLFGTSNPQSDWDFKAVVLPSARDILLGKTVFSTSTSTGNYETRNASTDVDTTVFSLQKYVQLLTKMETNALEMLFAPSMTDPGQGTLMTQLRANRFKLLSTNKMAFLGFGRSQAMKYAVRGGRKLALERLVDALSTTPTSVRVQDTLIPATIRRGDMPDVQIVAKPQPGGQMIDFISAFGLEVAVTVKCIDAARVFERPLNEIGKRSAAAAENGGADWKGLYHAHRIVDEGLELFSTGELVFPCKNAAQYMAIRNAELPLDEVLNVFEDKLAALEAQTPIPDFAEKADTGWADNFVVMAHYDLMPVAYYKDQVLMDPGVRP